MSIPADVMDSFRDYMGVYPIIVNPNDSQLQIKTKIEWVNEEAEGGGSPAGRGQLVQLPPGRLLTQELTLPQAQSLRGVKGSTILALAPAATVSDQGGGVGAYITVDNDFRVLDNVSGQGVLEDLDIDASATKTILAPANIHGLYAPIRPNTDLGDNLHTMRNVAVYNARSNGIHFDQGNDKLVADRLRQEGSLGYGMYLRGGDIKLRAVGSVAGGSALKIAGAAVEMDQFDLWRPKGTELLRSQPTLDITGGSNGCVIKSGTVEGWTRFKGDNEADLPPPPSKRFINSKAQFAFVHFKYADVFPSGETCYLEAQSADLVELISCKFGASGEDAITTPLCTYLIRITNSSGGQGDGFVKISGGSGMLRFLGRSGPGAVNQMRIDALKHICNMPWRLLFDWGRMGTIEMVPKWAVGLGTPPDPTLRSHLACDGGLYSKRDFPFAFLNVAAYHGDWTASLEDLDTVPNFNTPSLPALSSECVLAIRAIP